MPAPKAKTGPTAKTKSKARDAKAPPGATAAKPKAPAKGRKGSK